MAVDLSEYVPDLKTEVNPPGSDLFPDATDEEWISMLRNAFWETVIDGVVVGYTESDGLVTPKTGAVDIARDQIQLVIYYAGIRVLKNRLSDLKTVFRSKAGPVEFETQQSAQVLKGLLDEAVRRRNYWLTNIANNYATDTYYIDAIISRENSMELGDTWWISS